MTPWESFKQTVLTYKPVEQVKCLFCGAVIPDYRKFYNPSMYCNEECRYAKNNARRKAVESQRKELARRKADTSGGGMSLVRPRLFVRLGKKEELRIMTKKELHQKLMDFLATLDDTVEDEWWGTERVLTGYVIRDLIDYLKLEKKNAS